MKKIILFVLCLTFLASAAIFIVVWQNKHTHSFTVENPTNEYLFSNETCTEKAKYYYSCDCGEKGSTLFEYGNALGHDLIHHESKQVTCTNIGYDEYDTCSRCNYTTYEVIPATGHTNGEWIIDVDATCTEDGSKHQICSVCTATIKTEIIAAKGHTDGEWIIDVDATCIEDGNKHQICSVCATTIKTETIAAKGHTDGEWIIDVDATCTEDGNKHQICSVCTATIKTKTITAIGHISSDWNIIIPKTCKTDGIKKKQCINCKKILEEKIINASHNIVIDQRIEPTCISEGLTEGQHCCDCNEVLIKQITISKIPHEIIVDKRLEPTCTKNGLTEGKHCKNCSYVEIYQETIDALGHSFMIQTNACSRCNEKEHMEFKTFDDWEKAKGEKSYVVWLSYLGMDTSHYYWQTIPETVEYVKLIGNPLQEYLFHLIIESRDKEITIEFVNVNLTSYQNHSIYCDSAIDVKLNFYGKKCSLIPTKAQNGINGGFSNNPGYGTNGYSAIYMPHANLNITTSANQLSIIGGEGGNGGDGGLLGVSDTTAKPGANGGIGIVAGEINVRFDGQSSLNNIIIKGGAGGSGGKHGGYGLVSYAKNGNSASESSVPINYIID